MRGNWWPLITIALWCSTILSITLDIVQDGIEVMPFVLRYSPRSVLPVNIHFHLSPFVRLRFVDVLHEFLREGGENYRRTAGVRSFSSLALIASNPFSCPSLSSSILVPMYPMSVSC